MNNPEKQWKLEAADIQERRHWDEYIEAYNAMLSATSTSGAGRVAESSSDSSRSQKMSSEALSRATSSS